MKKLVAALLSVFFIVACQNQVQEDSNLDYSEPEAKQNDNQESKEESEDFFNRSDSKEDQDTLESPLTIDGLRAEYRFDADQNQFFALEGRKKVELNAALDEELMVVFTATHPEDEAVIFLATSQIPGAVATAAEPEIEGEPEESDQVDLESEPEESQPESGSELEVEPAPTPTIDPNNRLNKVYAYNSKTDELDLIYEEQNTRQLSTVGVEGNQLILMTSAIGYQLPNCFTVWSDWKHFFALNLDDPTAGLTSYTMPEAQVQLGREQKSECTGEPIEVPEPVVEDELEGELNIEVMEAETDDRNVEEDQSNEEETPEE